jgi:P27 family predicted phage terminase small subunit
MGRRAANPQDQKSKGYPGKRKTKVERAIEEAAERAKLLASLPPESTGTLSPPAIIDHPMFAEAVAIWRVLVPELSANNLFNPTLDRYTFAAYCIYQAEFYAAHRRVVEKGHTFMGKAIAGGKRPWKNPDVDVRDAAFKAALSLAQEFALTPTARSKIEKMHSTMPNGPLFDRRRNDAEFGEGEEMADEVSTAPAEEDPIGILDRMDSPPPGQRAN